MSTRRPFRLGAAASVFLFLIAGIAPADAHRFRDEFPVTDGIVFAVAPSSTGDTLFLGGGFSYVGPPTGNGAMLDLAAGTPYEPYLKISGKVLAVAPDGKGGWYVGGEFTSVNGVGRNQLAHVRADGTLSDWDPVLYGPVRALAADDSTVFVGGFALFALDAVTGVQKPHQWQSVSNVYALALRDSMLYVGAGSRVLAIRATASGKLMWSRTLDGTVRAVALGDATVYAAGDFGTVGPKARSHLAAFDSATGDLLPWNPRANQPAYALAVRDTVVYVGGEFDVFAFVVPRKNFAALHAVSGRVLDWDPEPNSPVRSLWMAEPYLYVGGQFNRIAGVDRHYVAALDVVTGAASPWDPAASYPVYAVGASGSSAFVGGSFQSIGGRNTSFLAAVNARTGRVLPWNAGADNFVHALVSRGPRLYVGGAFSTLGGTGRRCLAALDAATAEALPWNPDADSSVVALVVEGGTVFAGGDFMNVGGLPRRRLAAVDEATGNVLPWNPEADNRVLALAPAGPRLLVGGAFTTVGGSRRTHLAAVDATAHATSWDPAPSDDVYALHRSGSLVYVGGAFSRIGGEARNHIAALDLDSGLATPWNPGADASVYALALRDAAVFAGGDFTQIGGAARPRIAVLDAATGSAGSWTLDFGYGVFALGLAGDLDLYLGGGFTPQTPFRGGLAAVAFSVPHFDPLPAASVWEGETLTLTASASYPGVDPLSYSGTFPSGAVFDPASLTMTWTPTFLQAGSHSARFTVTDGTFSDVLTVPILVRDVPAGPLLLDITDVPQDQGRQVRVHWKRSQYDAPGDGVAITGYALYRRDDPAPHSGSGPERARPALFPPGRWDYLLTVPARLLTEYQVIAPTLADSTAEGGPHWTAFFISALTADPEVFFDGAPDSGYSVDDLAPSAPPLLVSEILHTGAVPLVELRWAQPSDADVRAYAVHRGTDAAFSPTGENLLALTTETRFVDSTFAATAPRPSSTYKVVALDRAGNAGPAATVTQNQPAVPPEGALALAFSGANPARGPVGLWFTLPAAGEASVDVFALDGRRIRCLFRGTTGTDVQHVIWDLHDESGRRVAAGIYLARIRFGNDTETQKLTIVP